MNNNYIENRVLEVTNYILETGATVRSAAKKFGVCKSTIHKDVTIRLRELNPQLHNQILSVLSNHFETKHINGGIATRNKYIQ